MFLPEVTLWRCDFCFGIKLFMIFFLRHDIVNIVTIVGVFFSTVATLLGDVTDNKIYKKHQDAMKLCFLSPKYA